MSWDDVQERLVEAFGFLMRMPDREGMWLRVRAYWPDVMRHTSLGDYGDMGQDAPAPRMPGLTTAEVERMEQALDWVRRWVPERDRKLVGVVLGQLQHDGRPSWIDAAARLGGTVEPDALARRYERALGIVATWVNRLR